MLQEFAVGYLGVDVCRGVHELVHRKHADEYGYPKYKILKNICWHTSFLNLYATLA